MPLASEPPVALQRFGIPLFIVLYAVLAIGGPVIFAVYDYYRTTGAAEEHLTFQVERLARSATANLEEVDQTLGAVLAPGEPAERASPADEGRILQNLRDRVDLESTVAALAFQRADGRVVATSPEAGRVAGTVLRDLSPGGALSVEPLNDGGATPASTVAVARQAAGGASALALVPVEALADMRDLVLWDEAETVSAWTTRGALLAAASSRSGQASAPVFPTLPGAEVQASPDVVATSDTAGNSVVWRSVAEGSLIVAAAVDRSVILWPWYLRSGLVVLASLVLTAKAAVVFWLLRSRERERRQMVERLARAERLEALGSMAGGIAHDFRNFLSLCGSLADRLGREVDGEAEPTLRQMEAALERGQSLTRSLTSFAKSGDFSLHEADPGALIRGIEPLLRQACGSRIDLRVTVALDLWTCGLDPGQFDSAIVNLVVNARAAMPEGGRITIGVRNFRGRPSPVDPSGEYVLIDVEDTGHGMPSNVLQRIGEPFFTTRTGEGGSGIGLSQSFSFVRRIGGNLTVESDEGKGTRVTLALRRFRGAPVASDVMLGRRQARA
ncbi:sensor histidine kinase [Marinivivus vitaminiproducens]|uniref:sensor histidine kinase n=1 Tax=Marinivivus vitaminiproducens TaxID=3035935 RepID=UPI0027A914F4|nr:ATP-binding protein [Geminicoccaceae bacterium SCSIO 64248]